MSCSSIESPIRSVESISTKDSHGMSWLINRQEEEAMDRHHLPYWRTFASRICSAEIVSKQVLDFGCSRGGFLRMLSDSYGIQHGMGIDRGRLAIESARRLTEGRPLSYEVADSISPAMKGAFDTAFSYEVIYLIPDLEAHAVEVFDALRHGGSYYAATGCHTDSPIWPICKSELIRSTNLVPYDYSLENYRDAFSSVGFEVSACRLAHTDFVRVDVYPEYFPTVESKIEYFARDVVVFKFTKPNV